MEATLEPRDNERAGTGLATRVVVYGVDEMVPSVLDDAEKRAWLSTPLAGAPLYRRLLEPLVGLNVAELDILDTGAAARALAHLMANRGYFGTTPRLVTPQDIESMAIEQLVLYPGHILSLNARDLSTRLQSAFAAGQNGAILRLTEPDGEAEAVIVAGSAAQFLKPELINEPTFECAADLAKRSEVRPIACDSIRGYRPASPARLVDLARAALDEKLFSPVGMYENGVLIGPRAKICKGAVLDGAAAVGAESYIAPSAMLCEGSIVGEQCYVGEGALVSDAIVLDGAHVAPGEFVLSVVRGPRGKIEL